MPTRPEPTLLENDPEVSCNLNWQAYTIEGLKGLFFNNGCSMVKVVPSLYVTISYRIFSIVRHYQPKSINILLNCSLKLLRVLIILTLVWDHVGTSSAFRMGL